MILTCSLQKLSHIVTDMGLTELIGQKGFTVTCGMNEGGSTVMIGFCLHGILLFEK